MTTDLNIADELELYMLGLINAAREDQGLDALLLEQHLNLSAEEHSLWMLAEDVFSHTGASGSSHDQRITDAGFATHGYTWATGENLAISTAAGGSYFDEIDAMFQGLMDSPGHRANILNATYDYVGIGIELDMFNWNEAGIGSVGDRFTIIATQNFGMTTGEVLLDNGPTPDPQPQPEPIEDLELTGDDEDNELIGHAGNDNIMGRRGNDVIEGNAGNDRLIGNVGNDSIWGGDGRDVLKGGSGNDMLDGGTGNDRLKGNADDDILIGGDGDDRIRGNRGNDDLQGGDGDDRLMAGGENDTLNGGTGNDILEGGRGADVFIFETGGDFDRIIDFELANDSLAFSAALVGGLTDGAAIVDAYAEVTTDGVLFAFGGGDSLLIEGLTNTAGLDGLIDTIA